VSTEQLEVQVPFDTTTFFGTKMDFLGSNSKV